MSHGCNLCGGTHWEILEEVAGTRVLRCSCGLMFLWPQPPREVLEQAYDEAYYRPWDGQARRRSRIWQQRMERVEGLAGRTGRLLDVGCGTGTFLHLAWDRGWDVTGTELSPHGAKAAAATSLKVYTGEVWEAPLPAEVFDVVTCWHVIEHVSDPRRVMEEIHRVLRPGGWCVLATPNLEDWIFRAAYILARARRPRPYEAGEREVHLYGFSAHTLARLVKSVGFMDVVVGFDRGAAAVWSKHLVNEIAYAWYRLTGRNWGMALELVARRPEPRSSVAKC